MYLPGCLEGHATPRFPESPRLGPALWRDWEPQPWDQRACFLSAPISSQGPIRQLLPVYITGHRDHRAQPFEISHKSANNALNALIPLILSNYHFSAPTAGLGSSLPPPPPSLLRKLRGAAWQAPRRPVFNGTGTAVLSRFKRCMCQPPDTLI